MSGLRSRRSRDLADAATTGGRRTPEMRSVMPGLRAECRALLGRSTPDGGRSATMPACPLPVHSCRHNRAGDLTRFLVQQSERPSTTGWQNGSVIAPAAALV